MREKKKKLEGRHCAVIEHTSKKLSSFFSHGNSKFKAGNLLSRLGYYDRCHCV
jgi:hypothetical protein